jgi:hypothetical protein
MTSSAFILIQEKVAHQIRVQVKSRYATDCDRGFPVIERTLGAFDFLIVAFLNIGSFFRKSESIPDDRRDPEFYTLPVDFIRRHHDKSSSWEKVRTRKLDIEMYKNDEGFEPIAQALGVDYPDGLRWRRNRTREQQQMRCSPGASEKVRPDDSQSDSQTQGESP